MHSQLQRTHEKESQSIQTSFPFSEQLAKWIARECISKGQSAGWGS